MRVEHRAHAHDVALRAGCTRASRRRPCARRWSSRRESDRRGASRCADLAALSARELRVVRHLVQRGIGPPPAHPAREQAVAPAGIDHHVGGDRARRLAVRRREHALHPVVLPSRRRRPSSPRARRRPCCARCRAAAHRSARGRRDRCRSAGSTPDTPRRAARRLRDRPAARSGSPASRRSPPPRSARSRRAGPRAPRARAGATRRRGSAGTARARARSPSGRSRPGSRRRSRPRARRRSPPRPRARETASVRRRARRSARGRAIARGAEDDAVSRSTSSIGEAELAQHALLLRDERRARERARVRRVDLDDALDPARARRHHDDAVGEVQRLLHVVRHEQAGVAVARRGSAAARRACAGA